MAGFLSKERSVASPGYCRWLIPPASLAIHLAIGEVYAFSVFKIPLTHLIGGDHRADGDWTEKGVFWTFSIAIAVLGLSTALFGKWLERSGPRKAMFISACCFAAGFQIAAIGVHLHQLWLIYMGYGVVGGVGLGLGYLAPVANLVRWFPDRPGLATGMAIMGFGGGALIGSPLAATLMRHFNSTSPQGIAPTMVVMGVAYFIFMMFGVLTIRVPPPDYMPDVAKTARKPASTRNVAARVAFRTPQFYLLWLVLCLNTTAGIGIIEQASPLVQDLFHARFATKESLAAVGAGFVGFIGLFNMGGRFFWSALSDYLGRKSTFVVFFVLGACGFVAITYTGSNHLDNLGLFALTAGLLISMYGGGFATMPAYLRDVFGTREMNAIYGVLLTAWSVAGVAGPLLVNTLHGAAIHNGATQEAAYATVFHVMAGLLVIGLLCDLLVRRVDESKTIEAGRQNGEGKR